MTEHEFDYRYMSVQLHGLMEICVRNGAEMMSQPKLDRAKLLGFRNLAAVTTPDSDIHDSADMAFCKRGEVPTLRLPSVDKT